MERAVLFDMDGVLIFSEHGHFMAFQEVAREVLAADLSLDGYHTYFAGRTDAAGWQAFCDANRLPCDLHLLLKRVGDAYMLHFKETVEPNWSVVDVLRELAMENVAIGITSSSTQREVEMTIDVLHLRTLVRASVSADMIQEGKPHPAPYLLTAQFMGIEPTRSVVIEDSPAGVASARAAGMKCIALTTTHSRESLQKADLVLDVLTSQAVLGLLPAE